MVASLGLGPILNQTLVAGGCAWDTRRGKATPPATDNDPVVLDQYDIYAVVDYMQRGNVAVSKCTLDEIKFKATDDSKDAQRSARLAGEEIAYRVLIKFAEYNSLAQAPKDKAVKLLAALLAEKEGPASLESLMTFMQGLNYTAYCRTNNTWYAPAIYGQIPDALALKNVKVSDIKAVIEKAKVVPLTIAPNSGMAGQTLTVTLSSDKLPEDLSELEISFGEGITVGTPEAAGTNKAAVEITIDENAKGVRDVVVKQGDEELVGGKGLFAIAPKPVVIKPVVERVIEKPTPAPAPEPKPRAHRIKPAQAPADDFGAAPQL